MEARRTRFDVDRDTSGRFTETPGARWILEYEPRLGTLPVLRALQDPRRCAYRLLWWAEDSAAGAFTRDRQGVRHLAHLRVLGDLAEVTIGGWSVQNICLERRAPAPSGWQVLYRCPLCGRATRYLYVIRALRCRRCARFRWASEGRRTRRLARNFTRLVGRVVELAFPGWGPRVMAERLGGSR